MKKDNNFTGNVPVWLAMAEQKIDYYTQFIKSWIPFNAWYMVSYHNDTLNSDRKIIDEIKFNNNNPFRDKIKSLLQGHDSPSKNFIKLIYELHNELEAHPIPSHQNRISFSSINIVANTKTQNIKKFRNLVYKVNYNRNSPRGSKRLKCEIFKGASLITIYTDELYDWSMDELNKSAKYQGLAPERKEQLRLCFEDINPHKPVDIIKKPTRGKNNKYSKPLRSISINEETKLYFVDDLDLVSQVIVELLYKLRCVLFHGELNPTESNQSVYEKAYYIMRILIQELH